MSASHVVRAVLLPSPFETLGYLGTAFVHGTLGAEMGRLVRVGGLVAAIAGLTVTIDDGSAPAIIQLPEAARSLAQELAIGDPLNVVGRVSAVGGGCNEVD